MRLVALACFLTCAHAKPLDVAATPTTALITPPALDVPTTETPAALKSIPDVDTGDPILDAADGEGAFLRAGADHVWIWMIPYVAATFLLSWYHYGFLRNCDWPTKPPGDAEKSSGGACARSMWCPSPQAYIEPYVAAWRDPSSETLTKLLAAVAAAAFGLLAALALPIADWTGDLGSLWLSPDYLCFVAYDGVICNSTYVISELNKTEVQLPSVATDVIYAGTGLFGALIVLTVAVHGWRLRAAESGVLYVPAPTTAEPLPDADLAAAPVPSQKEEQTSLFSWRAFARGALARCQRPLTHLWLDWLQPAVTGMLLGLSMAGYQMLLQCVMCAVWGNGRVSSGDEMHNTSVSDRLADPITSSPVYTDTTGRSTSPLAVILIPAGMLMLSGVLQSYLSSGSAANFVACVTHNWHIDPFRGLVATTVVSIVAIASGGSAGPEGPVLFIGASIGVTTRLLRTFPQRLLASMNEGGLRRVPSVNSLKASENDWKSWWHPSTVSGQLRPVGDDALIGGAAAIAAFFDYPISGCLFVMELPHMHGSVHKGDVLPAALIASCFAWWVHRWAMDVGNLMPVPTFRPAYLTYKQFWWALPCGLFAGALSYAFVSARRALDKLPYTPWARGLIMGTLVGLIGLYVPDTLTWGEYQIEIIARYAAPLGWQSSTFLAAAKFVAIILTISSGYTAGIVYPLVMVGYLCGPLVNLIIDADHSLGVAGIDMSELISEGFATADTRGPGIEVISQTLGSGLLAGVMRAPVGTALLIGFMGRAETLSAEPAVMALHLLTNFIACYVNPLSGLGPVYGPSHIGSV